MWILQNKSYALVNMDIIDGWLVGDFAFLVLVFLAGVFSSEKQQRENTAIKARQEISFETGPLTVSGYYFDTNEWIKK